MKLNRKGFSLIELMIVVAIIGILAAIALPNFTRFQRKARQSEAKGLLGAYHTAIKSSAAELGCFRGNFSVIGFQPEGELYYRTTGSHNANCPLPASVVILDESNCATTADTCAKLTKTWTEKATVVAGASTASVTNNAYLAKSAGFLGSSSAMNDEWTINEQKVLTNVSSGL